MQQLMVKGLTAFYYVVACPIAIHLMAVKRAFHYIFLIIFAITADHIPAFGDAGSLEQVNGRFIRRYIPALKQLLTYLTAAGIDMGIPSGHSRKIIDSEFLEPALIQPSILLFIRHDNTYRHRPAV